MKFFSTNFFWTFFFYLFFFWRNFFDEIFLCLKFIFFNQVRQLRDEQNSTGISDTEPEVIDKDKTAQAMHNSRRQCNICLKWFTAKNLYNHKRTHTKKQYECFHCGEKRARKQSIQFHLKVHFPEQVREIINF